MAKPHKRLPPRPWVSAHRGGPDPNGPDRPPRPVNRSGAAATITAVTVTDAAGLGRWSPHELRHSAASLLLAMDVPLKVVSETLGHSSIRVTADVYGHLLDDARAGAADAMERALWRDDT